MTLLDEIEADATPTVAHAEVCVDGRLLADYLDAREQMEGRKKLSAGMLEDVDLEALTARFSDLHQAVQAKMRRYTFACMDRVEREQLEDKHPPTQKQAKKQHQYNPDTFEPTLAGHTLVEIDGKPVDDQVERRVEHFKALYRSLPPGQFGWGTIAAALGTANYVGTQVPKSVRDIGDRTVSALSSITAQGEESA